MCPPIGTFGCSPLPSSGFRGRTRRVPCGSPPSSVLWVRTTARPSVHGRLWSPSAVGTSRGRRWRALLGSWGIPLKACPELATPADPRTPSHSRPSRCSLPLRQQRRHPPRQTISELNLRGLLPCCVRFAPTGHPVNGNTGYRPAGSLWAGGTRTRWIPLRGFTGSFQLLLFQAFPNAIYAGELEVRPGAPTTEPLCGIGVH